VTALVTAGIAMLAVNGVLLADFFGGCLGGPFGDVLKDSIPLLRITFDRQHDGGLRPRASS
jgi:hypothetical protein